MKYISHKIVRDEKSFSPQYEIVLRVDIESIHDARIMLKEECAEVYGQRFLEILEETEKSKPTNAILAIPASVIKEHIIDGG